MSAFGTKQTFNIPPQYSDIQIQVNPPYLVSKIMDRKTIARNYISVGAVLTTLFALLLRDFSIDPIRPVQWIGWAFIGLAIGIMTLFTAAELFLEKDNSANPNLLYVNRPIFRDFISAGAFTAMICLLIMLTYENDYVGDLFEFFMLPILLTFAAMHYLLHRLAKKLEKRD